MSWTSISSYVLSYEQETRKRPSGREVKVKDITSVLLCIFPWKQRKFVRKVGHSMRRKSTLNCPSKAPTARYLPSRVKQRLQMTGFLVSDSELSARKLSRSQWTILKTRIYVKYVHLSLTPAEKHFPSGPNFVVHNGSWQVSTHLPTSHCALV